VYNKHSSAALIDRILGKEEPKDSSVIETHYIAGLLVDWRVIGLRGLGNCGD
jgi:hypothetical protein